MSARRTTNQRGDCRDPELQTFMEFVVRPVQEALRSRAEGNSIVEVRAETSRLRRPVRPRAWA
ncbi:MAG: hypothetical protein M3N52_11585, partial [Actinomycetota bacterium]|nr:hypothetical protein [Actinomycetota bacterium]